MSDIKTTSIVSLAGELDNLVTSLPDTQISLNHLKLRMLQLTELAATMLCADPGNVKLLDFLQKQIPATARLLQETTSTATPDSSASSISFDLEDTNYSAVQVDAFGVPLSSANDTEELP